MSSLPCLRMQNLPCIWWSGTVADVKISGNEKTKPQVVWRAIQTKPGDYINVNKINEDRRKIYLLGAFENVEATVEPVQGRYSM